MGAPFVWSESAYSSFANEARVRFRQQEIRRLRTAIRELENVEANAMKINGALAKTGELQAIVKARFDTQGGSQGAKWAPLSKASLIDRHRYGFPNSPILVRSGTLRDAAVNADAKWSATAIDLFVKRRAGPRYVGYGKTKKKRRKGSQTSRDVRVEMYAMVLSSGGSTGVKKQATVPARPFFGPVTKDERENVDDLRDWLIRSLYMVVLQGGRVSDVL